MCRDSQADKIVANEKRRDMPLLHDDCIEIYLDTFHDHRTAFCFCTDPLGAQRDFTEQNSYQRRLDLGLDAKYHLRPNLTADITFKTDFAQVEADQEEVNLTRFELFFPEKRDFFLEGASIFRFGERSFSPILPANVLFFSRRIGLSEDNELVPLPGDLKMTGKAGSYNIGLLNMPADRTSYSNDDDELVEIPRTNFSVLRLQKDILSNSSIGLIGLNQQSSDDNSFNRNIGVDANIFLNSKTQVNFGISPRPKIFHIRKSLYLMISIISPINRVSSNHGPILPAGAIYSITEHSCWGFSSRIMCDWMKNLKSMTA